MSERACVLASKERIRMDNLSALLHLAGNRSLETLDGSSINCSSDRNERKLAEILKHIKYRKLPLISPGLIQLRIRGFRWAYKRRGLYLRGFITGIKKLFRNEIEVLIEIRFSFTGF